jgi:glucokinase
VRTALALDIGGSGARAARVGPAGIGGPVVREPLVAGLGGQEILRRLRELVASLDPSSEDAALGVSFPAFLDEAGKVAWCLNLPGLDGLDLRTELAPALPGLRVVPVPDLQAAALAEARLGAGRGVRRFLCVGLGTGANAAMAIDGLPLVTAVGCLGDAGHVCVEPDGPSCACGGAGCLEAIASGPALARQGGPIGLASAEAVVAAAASGRPDAVAILERAGRALGRAIASWSALLWPQRVGVFGGVAGAAGELLLAPAREELQRVGASYIVGSIDVVPGALGADAALAGAGLAAVGSRR